MRIYHSIWCQYDEVNKTSLYGEPTLTPPLERTKMHHIAAELVHIEGKLASAGAKRAVLSLTAMAKIAAVAHN